MKYKLFYDKKEDHFIIMSAALAFVIMPDKKPFALSNSAESLETLVDILISNTKEQSNKILTNYLN